MSYQESRTIAYLISTLLATGLYTFLAFQKYAEGGVEATSVASFWGSLMLIVIAVQIVLSILTAIAVSIIQAVATRDENFEQSDERDQLIELKANRISFSVFGIGFVLAMASLAIGQPPLVMFHLIVAALFTAVIVGYITQLVLYRRGF